MSDQTPVLECRNLCISYYTRAGEIPEFTGVSSPYEPPESPAVHLKTGDLSLDECAAEVRATLERGGFFSPPTSAS